MEDANDKPPLDWEAIKELAADALELPIADRAAFLDRVCADNGDLRRELASLVDTDQTLAMDAADRGGLVNIDVSAILASIDGARIETTLPEGTVFDGFVLGPTIGEGGMGRVYRATQQKPHRAVAIKVMRDGMVPAEAERRFAWEIEALGRLEHPAIARVYGAGMGQSPQGTRVPWFAMELIDGHPMLDACDRLHLDRGQRIELFLKTCEGVAHAHRRGVIHRDLKPDNVLVDASTAPHIVDFGIARTAEPVATVVTHADEIVGTLAYMSPEQVLGDAKKVDARTDVYALGVILFRMLTGDAPHSFDTATLTAVALKLTSEDARLAGSVDRSLKGSDLEAVLATALARDVDERYATVDAFADDLRRIQAHEPVAARAQTTVYQLRRFARRHRGLVASITVAFVLLVAGIIGTAVGLVQAQRALETAAEQTQKAETERDRARAVNTFLENMLKGADPAVQGRERTLAEWLALAGLELDADETLSDPVRASLRLTLGLTTYRLGELDASARHLEQATALFSSLHGPASAEAVEARAAWCETATEQGDFDAAQRLYEETRTHAAAMVDPPDWARIRARELLAGILDASGDPDGAVSTYREVLDFWHQHDPEGGDTIETARNNLAVHLLKISRPAESIELLRKSLRWRESNLRPDHPDILTVTSNLASALSELGEAAEAIELYQHLIPRMSRTLGDGHPHTLAALGNLASALDALEQHAEALPLYERVLETRRSTLTESHPDTITARNNVATCLMSLDRSDDAVGQFRAMYEMLSSQSPTSRDERLLLNVRMNLAAALSRSGRHQHAWQHSAAAVEGFEQLIGEEAMQTLITRNNHATLAWEVDRLDLAVTLAEKNLRLAQAHYPDHPYIDIAFRPNLGRSYRRVGRLDDALRELTRAEQDLAGRLDASPDRLAKYRRWIAEILTELGRTDEAEAWRKRARSGR